MQSQIQIIELGMTWDTTESPPTPLHFSDKKLRVKANTKLKKKF